MGTKRIKKDRDTLRHSAVFLEKRMRVGKRLQQAILFANILTGDSIFQASMFSFHRQVFPDWNPDLTSLPVESLNGRSKVKNKLRCFQAEISSIVLLYWRCCRGYTEFTVICVAIARLESKIEVGLKNLEIKGSIEQGYHLEIKDAVH